MNIKIKEMRNGRSKCKFIRIIDERKANEKIAQVINEIVDEFNDFPKLLKSRHILFESSTKRTEVVVFS